MGDKFNKIIEGYKPIASRRMFYPRNMKLSEDFINAFHREYDRLVGEGQNVKSLVERFGKAMKFHAGEDRKYHKIDEEKAAQELEERNTMKFDPDSGKYHRDTGKAFGGSKRAMNQDPRPHSSYTGKKKPDYLDVDGDGDKKESMKKALKDKNKDKK